MGITQLTNNNGNGDEDLVRYWFNQMNNQKEENTFDQNQKRSYAQWFLEQNPIQTPLIDSDNIKKRSFLQWFLEKPEKRSFLQWLLEANHPKDEKKRNEQAEKE